MRLVHFIDQDDDTLGNGEMLEIETKGGRFWHLQPLESGSSLALQPGPARPPDGLQGAERAWRDLSEALPGAFDGRPTVQRLEPTTGTRKAEREASAEAWLLHLSTGYRVTCRRAGDRLELTGAYRRQCST
mgnify:FL=1